MQTRQEPSDESEHGGVDDEQEEPERDDRDGKRQDHRDRPHNGVYDSQQQACEQQGPEVIRRDARNPAGRNPKTNRGNKRANYKSSHGTPFASCSAKTLRRARALFQPARIRRYCTSPASESSKPEPISRTIVPRETAGNTSQGR